MKQLFETQTRLMDAALEDGKEDLSLSVFNSNIMSPIDFQKSKIVYFDRGFNSISVDAQFFTVDTQSEDANSHSNTIMGSFGGGFSGMGAEVSSKVSTAVHNTVTNTLNNHDVESTLLLTSWATHSKVKQFCPLIVDCDLLLDAWNYYHKDNKIVLDKLSAKDVEKTDKEENEPTINLFTECCLGSAMVGMVHFIKKEKTSSNQSSSESSFELMASVEASCIFGSITGDTAIGAQMAKKAANSLSTGGMDVKFDLICLGYLPTLKANNVKIAIESFKSFDPALFSAETEMSQVGNMDNVSKNLIASNKSSSKQQSNMSTVIQATLMGLQQNETTYQVLDYNTFLNAFDDYVKNAATTEGVGIPIGMNLKPYTKREVIAELFKKYYPKNPSPPDNNNNDTSKPADDEQKNDD